MEIDQMTSLQSVFSSQKKLIEWNSQTTNETAEQQIEQANHRNSRLD